MKFHKKYIITIIVLVIIGALLFTKRFIINDQSETSTTAHTSEHWKEVAPTLFTNAGYNKLLEQPVVNQTQKSPDTQINQDEAFKKNRGTITNQFGIRDDILTFIIQSIPPTNESAIYAAIKIAQNDQKIYYTDITQDEALKLESNSFLAGWCLILALPDNFDDLKISRGISKLMRNTKERDDHMWAIDRKFFAWKAITSGLNIAEEDLACKEGNY